jgi:ANTAR domain/PAS fold
MSSPAVSRHSLPSHAAHPGTGKRPSAPEPRNSATSEATAEATCEATTSGTAPRPAGRYRFDRRSAAWWWSPEMTALHGLPPEAQPDTDTLLAQQHPEDRDRVLAVLSAAGTAGRPFTLRTRIVRPDGERREVVLVGEPELDADGTVTAVEGLCIDITGCAPPGADVGRVEALQTEVEQLRAAMASRATIEQAKGILMLLTNCGGKVAFDLLTHISSHTHRKVRDVAQVLTESASGHARLPADVRAILRDACPPAQPLR